MFFLLLHVFFNVFLKYTFFVLLNILIFASEIYVFLLLPVFFNVFLKMINVFDFFLFFQISELNRVIDSTTNRVMNAQVICFQKPRRLAVASVILAWGGMTLVRYFPFYYLSVAGSEPTLGLNARL